MRRTGIVRYYFRLGTASLGAIVLALSGWKWVELGAPLSTTTHLKSSSSPTPRISYRLHDNATAVFSNKFGSSYQCTDTKKRKRSREPAAVYETKGVLDFGATVETNLNILFMGDSVGIQFSQAFEEAAAGYDRRVIRETARWTQGQRLIVLEGLHSAPTKGGGWVAGWRITGLLMRNAENKPLPNEHGGGWTREDLTKLQNHMQQYYRPEDSTRPTAFDTIVYRIPQGWIPSLAVNESSLRETVELAHELFGVKSVIFVTLPLCNNYMETADIQEMRQANERILNFTQNFKATSEGVEHVMALDFGQFAWDLVSLNANLLGFEGPLEHVYTKRLDAFFKHEFFPAAEAHVCSRRMDASGDCQRNFLSFDGMHWCLETIGGRVIAGLACLMACVHNEDDVNAETRVACAQQCNDQFMSLVPV